MIRPTWAWRAAVNKLEKVSSVFEATIDGGKVQPDGAELREVRFVNHSEASALPLAAWVPEVLGAVFGGTNGNFRPPNWRPQSG